MIMYKHSSHSFLQERRNHIPPKAEFTRPRLLEAILEDDIFGLAECDVDVPENLKDHYSQFPPVFKNVDVSLDDVGAYMKDLCKKSGFLKKPRRTLISSFFGKKVVLTTDQMKWYLKNGEYVYSFMKNKIFI